MRKSVQKLKFLVTVCFMLAGLSRLVISDKNGLTAAASSYPLDLQAPAQTNMPSKAEQKNAPANNSVGADKVILGKALFFDKRLSVDGTVSCAVCHDPASAFADNNVVAIGVDGKKGTRNVPTLLGAAFNPVQMWDGRADSLEAQILHPLTSSAEMNMASADAVVARVAAVPSYKDDFRRVFGRKQITIEMIAQAIAAYERTLVSGNSPFDRFLAGDTNAVSEAQKRGWQLFQGNAECHKCHTISSASPFFSDFSFHNTGIATRSKDFNRLVKSAHEQQSANSNNQRTLNQLAHTAELSELGRFLVTKDEKDTGAFKTPTLRDVELTSPYMHDGSIKTLLDVVRFYNRGGEPNQYLDKDVRRLNLSESEMSDLVEFLRALTSDDVLRTVQTTRPQNRQSILTVTK